MVRNSETGESGHVSGSVWRGDIPLQGGHQRNREIEREREREREKERERERERKREKDLSLINVFQRFAVFDDYSLSDCTKINAETVSDYSSENLKK